MTDRAFVTFRPVRNVAHLGQPAEYVPDGSIDVIVQAIESVREVGANSVLTLRSGAQFTVAQTLDEVREWLGAYPEMEP